MANLPIWELEGRFKMRFIGLLENKLQDLKNSEQIKERLKKFVAEDGIHQIMKLLPGVINLPEKEQIEIENSLKMFLEKLLKHLNTKKPSKSGITNIVNQIFYKLLKKVESQEGIDCYLTGVTEIINKNFEDFFFNRLNVKSKEFIALEDWNPSIK